jgi:hypothetical protein
MGELLAVWPQTAVQGWAALMPTAGNKELRYHKPDVKTGPRGGGGGRKFWVIYKSTSLTQLILIWPQPGHLQNPLIGWADIPDPADPHLAVN